MGSVGYSLKSILQDVIWKPVSSQFSGTLDCITISDVTTDSRNVIAGALFLAIVGAKQDGHMFIDAAVAQGCKVVVVQEGAYSANSYIHCMALVLEVPDTTIAYGTIAANFYGNPAKSLSLLGVTGTNGKTTVTYLLEDILTRKGFQVGVVGTVNNRFYDCEGKQIVHATSLTTPDAKVLHGLFRQMLDAGVEYVIMEVSSHAVAQHRIESLFFDVAAFTNLSRDHLDYHGSMDDYFSAKSHLFAYHLKPSGFAVIPADSRHLESRYADQLRVGLDRNRAILTWGEDATANIRLLSHHIHLTHTEFSVRLAGVAKDMQLNTSLVGRFNIDNLLVVIAVCQALGLGCDYLQNELPLIHGAPGRLERVADPHTDASSQPVVFVDYAHTPDALEKLLETLGELPHDELIAVFGCGGDRDNGKRPLMGKIAGRLADVVVVTNDNPRSEGPQRIVEHIIAGIAQASMPIRDAHWLQIRDKGERGCVVEPDRRKAIELAIRIAKPLDIVAIAGKGHEPYQLGSEGKKFFDDRLEAARVLGSWTGAKLAKVTGGALVQGTSGNHLLGEVTTDSRAVSGNSIFVALRGETHDGHDYLSQVVEAGASCLVVEQAVDLDCQQLIVEDTTKALGDMAHGRRMFFASTAGILGPKVIGLTGSSGKTTTKEMIASILAKVWPVGEDYPDDVILKTKGNFNNLIGLPLSLLPLHCQHKAAVLEMGMNAPGEIKRLAQIAVPDICCILNVHGAHLAGLGSVEGVAAAKGELFEAAGVDSIFVVNLDDQHVKRLAAQYLQKKITFGLSQDVEGVKADIWASDIVMSVSGEISFNLHVGGTSAPVLLRAIGEHNVSNSLAASAVACAAGATLDQIVQGLQSYKSPAKRMERLAARAGWTVLSDCYNANPASMAAALQALSVFGEGKRVAVLGDMFELGDAAPSAHRETGALAAKLNIDFVVAVGEHASLVAEGALAGGMITEQVLACAEKEEVAIWIENCQENRVIREGDVVLFKGSRGMTMETLVDRFVLQS